MINLNGEFVWWMGVVEDINDPELIGRARVRIAAYHTADKEVLPTVALPWAHPIFPITSASNRGKGLTVPGLMPGSHVFGFFLDGTDAQQPVIMGSVPGINEEENDPTVGFNDPYDKSDPLYDGKPDTNLLAYNYPGDGMVGSKKEPKRDVENALGKKWTEPISEANPVYPFNKVYESNSGHLVEVDDSPGAERIHIYHRKGSFVEIYPNGTVHIKATGHAPEAQGPDGAGNDFNPDFADTVGMFVVVEPDAKVYVGGSVDLNVEGNINIVGKNLKFKGDKVHFELEDDFIVHSKKFQVKASENIDMASSGEETKIGAANTVKIVNGGGAKIVMESNTINLNPPS